MHRNMETVEKLLWVWTILDLGMCSISLPQISDRKFIDECVSEHNKARTAVSPSASNMLYMTWDEALAVTARAWARRCEFQHNIYLRDVRRVHPNFTSVGENIWTGSPPSTFNTKRAIESWVEESTDYNYRDNTCTKVCGHYTQVVWAKSYKVGCAVQRCSKGVKYFTQGDAAIFVCNYGPGGNVIGLQPYDSQNAACSGCEGRCVEKLCRSPERDSLKSYSWTPDWDPVSSDSKYWIILLVRPIGVVLTIITAFTARYFYPDVFCYE